MLLPPWLNVPRETVTLWEGFLNELAKWSSTINLVSDSDLRHLADRHVADSAQLLRFIPPGAKVMDVGSGAGFPGIVLACNRQNPVTLVESDRRKAAFLRHVATKLAIPITVHAARIETLAPQTADIITARALAPLSALLSLIEPQLHQATICLFPKGKNYAKELEATSEYRFQCEAHPSLTQADAVILKLHHIERIV